jgi:DNA-binding CsgD family transcriptional regulator
MASWAWKCCSNVALAPLGALRSIRSVLDHRSGIRVEPGSSKALASLSPRELEVLEMASQGSTNIVIASGLGLSVHGVKFHLASIYRKLGVGNRTEAAVAFLSGSVVQPANPQESRQLDSSTAG